MSNYDFSCYEEFDKNQAEKDARELLSFGGFLIGSRALEVSTKDCDWDIAILRKNIPNRFTRLPELPIEDYFSVLPMLNSSLIRMPGVDILIYDDELDFLAVKSAMKLTAICPKELLQNKSFRINAFEEALRLSGRFK